MLYVVMEQYKYIKKNDKFVQDVTCTPETMAILCNEQQLCDHIRFCCDPYEFDALGVDPLSINQVYVDVTLVTKHNISQ